MVQAVSGRNPENFSGFFFGEIFSDFMPSGLEHADVNRKIISVTTTNPGPPRRAAAPMRETMLNDKQIILRRFELANEVVNRAVAAAWLVGYTEAANGFHYHSRWHTNPVGYGDIICFETGSVTDNGGMGGRRHDRWEDYLECPQPDEAEWGPVAFLDDETYAQIHFGPAVLGRLEGIICDIEGNTWDFDGVEEFQAACKKALK